MPNSWNWCPPPIRKLFFLFFSYSRPTIIHLQLVLCQGLVQCPGLPWRLRGLKRVGIPHRNKMVFNQRWSLAPISHPPHHTYDMQYIYKLYKIIYKTYCNMLYIHHTACNIYTNIYVYIYLYVYMYAFIIFLGVFWKWGSPQNCMHILLESTREDVD